jgi:hypothetical protein
MFRKVDTFYVIFFKLVFFLTLLLSRTVFSEENPANFVKFTNDFDAKCVSRGGVMIYISNSHFKKPLKVTLERWYMNYRTADRSRSILNPSTEPEALGCSMVSNGKQEWKVKDVVWLKKYEK